MAEVVHDLLVVGVDGTSRGGRDRLCVDGFFALLEMNRDRPLDSSSKLAPVLFVRLRAYGRRRCLRDRSHMQSGMMFSFNVARTAEKADGESS